MRRALHSSPPSSLPQPRARASRRSAAPAKRSAQFFDPPDVAAGLQLWGKEKKDALADKETLLWNADWQTQLDSDLEELRGGGQRASPAPAAKQAPRGSGFLSLSRSFALDDPRVQVDSPRLRSAQAEAGVLAEALAPIQDALRPSSGLLYAPTRGERKQWSRTAKFSRSSSTQDVRDAKEGEAEREAERLADLERYASLKTELLSIAGGTGVAVTACLAALYDAETAASYALGTAGGLLYLRLLARSVDSTSRGASSVGDVVEGTIGGQRLLIPALLVASWNRWNALGAPATGFELHFAPMLAGFFTYKVGSWWTALTDAVRRPIS